MMMLHPGLPAKRPFQSNRMAARILSVLVFNPLVFTASSQPAGLDMKKLDYHNARLSDTIVTPTKKVAKQSNEAIQLTYYPDSIIPGSSFIPKSSRVNVASFIDGASYDTIVVSNPWIKEFPVAAYRLLSIQNNSNISPKILVYGNNYVQDHGQMCTHFRVDKVLVLMEAKDETGTWRAVNKAEYLENEARASKGRLHAYQKINVLIKKPEGDFETEIRFKLLISRQPEYPMEKFVYSNVFKGSIDKSLFEKK